MKNKLKLILWGKNLESPIDYDNLEFDKYKLKYDYGYELFLYKNNEIIKKIYWFEDGNLSSDWNYKNGKFDGKQHGWYENGNKKYEDNYKNGERDGKQYDWHSDGNKYGEWNFKNGKKI